MNTARKALVTLIIATSGGFFPQVPAWASEPKSSEKSEWIFITSSSDDTHTYSGKRGSFEITTTKGGISVAMLLGQIENKSDKSVTFNKWYVSTSDCESGIGKLVALKVDGDYDFEADYVSKGKSIASYIADTICSVYRSDLKTKQEKGV